MVTGPPLIFQALSFIGSRSLFHNFSSTYYLFPRASVWNDTILVSTPTRNYTANDYQQLFTDAGYPQRYTQLSAFSVEYSAPNVPTYCFYGLGFPTPMSIVYGPGFPDALPTFINGDGDNTLNKESLEVCLRWANSSYPFNRTVFQDIDHLAIVTDETVLQTIGSIVGAPMDPINGTLHACIANAASDAASVLFIF